MTVEERRRRRFSESFRKEQVCLIESGELTILDVSKLYEVKTNSVRAWIKKFGTKELPERILVTNGSEYSRIKALEEEIKNLKEVIGDQQLKLIVQGKIIDRAEEKLGKGFEKK